MLFILKKEKEKKPSVTKTQLMNPFCTKLERRRRERRKILEVGGAPVFEELYELLKDYFHMAASDI